MNKAFHFCNREIRNGNYHPDIGEQQLVITANTIYNIVENN